MSKGKLKDKKSGAKKGGAKKGGAKKKGEPSKGGKKGKASKGSKISKTGKKGKKGSKTNVKGGSKDRKSKTSSSSTSVGSGVASLMPTANPEQISKNKGILEKICTLLEKTKPEQVTRTTKDDLNKIQQIIQNISMRDHGDLDRVRDVPLSEKQKAIIWKISGLNCDDVDTLTLTITEGSEDPTPPREESKEDEKVEKLDLAPTKG